MQRGQVRREGVLGVSTATVVGGGPNGLAAAVTLAAGVQVTVLEAADEIGGGTRTSEAILPGLLHDHCSAIHPMAVGSPFCTGSTSIATDCRGAGRRSTARTRSTAAAPALLYRSVEDTAAGLGRDGAGGGGCSAGRRRASTRCPRTSWGRCCGCRTTRSVLARFGAPTVLPASVLATVLSHRARPARCSEVLRRTRSGRCTGR